MVWMEVAAYSASVSPVFNDLDLEVIAFDGSTYTSFYPNGLSGKDYDNTVEKVVIPAADSYVSLNVTVSGTYVTTTRPPYYALVVEGGQVASNSSSSSSQDKEWFVRWKMVITGIPVAEAATANFELGLSRAISSRTGSYTNDDSTVVVKIDRTASTTSSSSSSSSTSTFEASTVTVEISVPSESDGFAVMTYILSISEGDQDELDDPVTAEASMAGALALKEELNDVLLGLRTNGCVCVAPGAATNDDSISTVYDCGGCEDGTMFSEVQKVSTDTGAFDLYSSVSSPSALDSLPISNGRDGGVREAVLVLLRAGTYLHALVTVAAIVGCTASFGLCLRYCTFSGRCGRRGRCGNTGGDDKDIPGSTARDWGLTSSTARMDVREYTGVKQSNSTICQRG
ncbi:unnamed protein product [Choristocarpus tenellus]